MSLHGKLVDVTTRRVGVEVTAASTGVTVSVDDAGPLEETGGTLTLYGETVEYIAADLESETVTLTAPLTLAEGDRLELSPAKMVVVATVRVDDDDESVQAIVPLNLRTLILEGIREDPSTAETVLLDWDGNSLTVTEVVGAESTVIVADSSGRSVQATADGLALLGPDGDVISVLDWGGGISGSSLSVNGDAEIGGVSLLGTLGPGEGPEPGWFDQFPWGVVATLKATSRRIERGENEDWGYTVMPFTAKAGRTYRVAAECEVQAATSDKFVRGYLRVKTGGDPAQVSDAWASFSTTSATVAGQASAITISTLLSYEVETEVSVLLTFTGFGTKHTPHLASMLAEDIGPIIPNSGAYSTGGAVPAGGGTPDPDPDPVVKRYQSTWHANGSATYRGNGVKRTDSPDLVQGYTSYATINGHCQSAILFTGLAVAGETTRNMNGALNGATLEKAEVFLYFNHWLYGAGGTARIGKLKGAGGATGTSVPATLSADASKAYKWRRGQGKWVTVPTSWFTDGNRGITLGGGSSKSGEYYGRADGHTAATHRRPRVRLTYTR